MAQSTGSLPLMRYKSFIWPNNPSQCKYSCDRTFAKHKYPELVGVDIEDFDPDAAIISGTGEFFGPTAYSDWQRLNAIFKEHNVGEFYHPIFTDVTKGLMTKLDASLEPRSNYVAYQFEIIQQSDPPTPVRPVSNIVATASATSSTSGGSQVYIVVKNDNLWNIAKRFTGNGANCWAIAKYNNIKNPNLIYPGQRITIHM